MEPFIFPAEILRGVLVDEEDKSVPLNADGEVGRREPICSVSALLPPKHVSDP